VLADTARHRWHCGVSSPANIHACMGTECTGSTCACCAGPAEAGHQVGFLTASDADVLHREACLVASFYKRPVKPYSLTVPKLERVIDVLACLSKG